MQPMNWQQISICSFNRETHVMRGQVPPPMSGMCGSSLNGEMYIFGGCNEDGHTDQVNAPNSDIIMRTSITQAGLHSLPVTLPLLPKCNFASFVAVQCEPLGWGICLEESEQQRCLTHPKR